ncbi:hypothetical protein [Streptomyces mirabilis]|uniref:hypothetical protein n=1 Tax=Streptomyces mirabilis TaxID=68239 RepID=UPI00332DAE89
MPESPALSAWLTEEDIQACAEDFALHDERAFTSAFNWYRNIERTNELLAPFRGRGIDVPARCTWWETGTWSPHRAPRTGAAR